LAPMAAAAAAAMAGALATRAVVTQTGQTIFNDRGIDQTCTQQTQRELVEEEWPRAAGTG
jgi:hypothetical protein